MGAQDFDALRLDRITEIAPDPDPVEFRLFGRTWTGVDVGEAAPGITRLAAVGNLPRWRWPFEMLVAVTELVTEPAEMDMAILTHGLDADTVSHLASWLVEEYGVRAAPQAVAENPDLFGDLHSKIEAELGPVARAADVKDEHLPLHIAAAGGQVG